jgi:hypothetical protein
VADYTRSAGGGRFGRTERTRVSRSAFECLVVDAIMDASDLALDGGEAVVELLDRFGEVGFGKILMLISAMSYLVAMFLATWAIISPSSLRVVFFAAICREYTTPGAWCTRSIRRLAD